MNRWIFAIFCATVFGTPLTADVFLDRQTTVEGLLPLGKVTIRSQVYIHGDQKREESVTTLSGLLGFASEPQKNLVLTDLEKGVQYRIHLDEKTYSVDSLRTLAEMWNAQAERLSQDTLSTIPDSSTVILLKSTWSVRGPLEKQTLHGYETEHYVIEWVSVWADTVEQETLQHTFTLDLWNSEDPGLAQALKEEADYQSRLLEAMGIDVPEALRTLSGIPSALLFLQTQFPSDAQQDLEKQLSRIKGETVRMVLTAKTVVLGPKPEEEETPEQEPESSGSPFGGLFGKIQKKVQEQLQKPIEEELERRVEERLRGPLIEIQSEILKAQTEPLDPKLFEIPEGFQEVPSGLQR